MSYLNQVKRFYIYHALTRWMPDTQRFNTPKCALLRWCGVEVGKNVTISSSVSFDGFGHFKICDGAYLAPRAQIWGNGTITIGEHAIIAHNSQVAADGRIEIGANTAINQSSILMANGDSTLSIGANCQIAHMVSLKTSHHEIDPQGTCIADRSKFSDITINDGCWICANATILPGVTIGPKCIVAAGAVVTKDTPAHSLAAGVPAIIKKYYTKKT